MAMRFKLTFPGLPHIATLRLIPACVALLSSALSGCVGASAHDRVWAYAWHGRTSNLSGCSDDGRKGWDSFLGAWLRVLRRNEHEILLLVHTSQPPTTVVVDLKVRNGTASGKWRAATGDRTLRAWLLRMPQSVFDESLRYSSAKNPLEMPDVNRILNLVDGPARGDDELTLALMGNVVLEADRDRVTVVRMDLATPHPIPVYREYFRWLVDLWRGSGSAFERSNIEHAQDCLQKAPEAPASIVGTMKGRWDQTNRPPML